MHAPPIQRRERSEVFSKARDLPPKWAQPTTQIVHISKLAPKVWCARVSRSLCQQPHSALQRRASEAAQPSSDTGAKCNAATREAARESDRLTCALCCRQTMPATPSNLIWLQAYWSTVGSRSTRDHRHDDPAGAAAAPSLAVRPWPPPLPVVVLQATHDRCIPEERTAQA